MRLFGVDEFPCDGDGLIRIATTRAVGIPDRALSRAATSGSLIWLAPGVYTLPAERRPEVLHRLRVLGEAIHADHVVSHDSAAALRGLPMLMPDLARLHLTSRSPAHGYRRSRRHLHPGTLTPDDIACTDGIQATTLARTAFDVARTSPQRFAGALAVFDAALALGADRQTMEAYCAGTQTGVGIARTALAHADSLSANPGESWGRAQMIAAGLPHPRLQQDVYADGRFIARPDYDWRDCDGVVRLIGEFDGIGKYLKYLRDSESPDDAIHREKQREGRLQDLGIIVVRWGWHDLKAGRVVPRIAAQLAALGLPTSRDGIRDS